MLNLDYHFSINKDDDSYMLSSSLFFCIYEKALHNELDYFAFTFYS